MVDMRAMICVAWAFDQDVSGWSVGRVRNMSGMWWGTRAFNQPLDRWDVSQVVVMDGLFGWTQAFHQSLAAWRLRVPRLRSCRGMLNNNALVDASSLSLWEWADPSLVASVKGAFLYRSDDYC